MVNDFEWPNGRYSRRKISPDTFPIKAVMALGVCPRFNASGEFDKFVPIANTLLDNQKTLYIEMQAEDLGKRKPEFSLLLAYAVGLIDLESLERILGPIAVNAERLKNDPSKVHLQISKNVVCCVPVDSAHSGLVESLHKYGIHLAKTNKAIDDEDINYGSSIADHINEHVVF